MKNINRLIPPRLLQWKHFKQALITFLLVLLFLVIQWVIKIFKDPAHMGIIESTAMEMTVETPEGAMPVETERVEMGPFISAITYTGSAVAYNDIPVFPRVEGWVRSMPVYPGDRVQKGQLLAQLDTRELSSRVSEAQFGQIAEAKGYYAALHSKEQAQAELDRTQKAIQSTKANLSYWQSEIERARALVKEEVITVEEFQREQSQFEAAESEYNQALAQLRASEKAVQSSEMQAQSQLARFQQAAANQRTQAIIRSYTTVTAEKSGVVTERNASPGTLVNPATQIFRMAQISPIRIQANIAESDVQRIQIGNTVRIWKRKAQNVSPIEGRVAAVFPATSLETRTSVVESVIPNEDERFVPGDYVVMEIQIGEKPDALSVPNTAVVTIDQQKSVWIVKDGKAYRRYVTTGATNGQRTEIVNGLKAGEIVITKGQQDLQDGVTVVSAEYGPEGLKALPKATTSNRLSEENQYRIKQSADHQMVTIELSPKPPKMGENELMIQVSSAHGSVSDKLSAELTTLMPAMPSMMNPKPKIEKLGAGQFKAKVMFTMPGLWKMTLILKDGRQEVARLTFDTKVPE